MAKEVEGGDGQVMAVSWQRHVLRIDSCKKDIREDLQLSGESKEPILVQKICMSDLNVVCTFETGI